MPTPHPQTITISTSTILKTIGILLGFAALWMVRDILLLVFSAVLLAGVMYPFARWAERHHIPKGMAVGAFYVLMLGVIALALVLLIPLLVDEVGMLANTYGSSAPWIRGLADSIKQFSNEQRSFSTFFADLSRLSPSLRTTVSGLAESLSGFFGGFAAFVVVLVLALYIVVEDTAIKSFFHQIIPEAYRDLSGRLSRQVVDKLGAWLRGQLVLGGIIALCYLFGFLIVGVPYPILLALLGGLLEFVPYLGPMLAAVPAMLLALSVSPMTAIATFVVIVIIQQCENHLIVPKVMQRAVGLNPIVSIVAFLIGARFFGIAGALFSIPVATAIVVTVNEIKRFRESEQESLYGQ